MGKHGLEITNDSKYESFYRFQYGLHTDVYTDILVYIRISKKTYI